MIYYEKNVNSNYLCIALSGVYSSIRMSKGRGAQEAGGVGCFTCTANLTSDCNSSVSSRTTGNSRRSIRNRDFRPTPAPATCEPTAAPEAPAAPAKPRGMDIVRVAGFDSAQMQKGAPTGWLLDIKKGEPAISLERGSQIYYLHMKSNESSYGVKNGIKVDIKEYPYLNWRWKVARLPDGGDVRKSDTDDQAIQIYVAFTPTGFPEALNTPVLGYIWDNEAPRGWTGRSSAIGGGKLRYVVVRNKTDRLGQWYTEKRNIYEDYKKLLKDVECADPAGVTHGVEFYINSQNTKSCGGKLHR